MKTQMSALDLLKYTQGLALCKSMVIDVTHDVTPG